jgi:hypothetical protein
MQRVDSSDYIKAKKQLAIYNELKNNVPNINPIKNNGRTYNENFRLFLPQTCNSPTDCSGGALAFAKNYALRLDFQQGRDYRTYKCDCNNQVTPNCPCLTSNMNDLSIPTNSNNCPSCKSCAL